MDAINETYRLMVKEDFVGKDLEIPIPTSKLDEWKNKIVKAGGDAPMDIAEWKQLIIDCVDSWIEEREQP